MATDCIPQVTFKFDPKSKPVVAAFDQPHASSDGGAILLKGIDTQLGLTTRLAAYLGDDRQPGKIQHQTLELLRQRLFGLACGYADCNDAARLGDDAIHKLLVDRDPEVVRHPGRDPKNNPRFVVTNLPDAPRTVYEQIYCQRRCRPTDREPLDSVPSVRGDRCTQKSCTLSF